ENGDPCRIVDIFVEHGLEARRVERLREHGGVPCASERVELHEEPAVERCRLAFSRSPVLGDVRDLEARCSHAAASFAWYVMTRSAPARRINVRTSRTAARRSSQPFAAAAATIAYSPLTL